MLKFKVGDKVKVIYGKDKGREGKIERIFPKKSSALVGGINVYKKHVRGASGQKGGIYDISRPLAFSKISVVCQKCKKTTRVGFRISGGEKARICKKCGRQIESDKKRQA